jgi:hypothetical protein
MATPSPTYVLNPVYIQRQKDPLPGSLLELATGSYVL